MEITDKAESFYYGGVPLKALAPNWADYTEDEDFGME